MTPPDFSNPSQLPPNPSLGLLANHAKGLRKGIKARDAEALRRLKSHPRFAASSDAELAAVELTLRDAQLVVAREYGFDNWQELKRHVMELQEGGSLDVAIAELMQAANNGDDETVRKVLDKTPDAVDGRGGEEGKSALHLAAANGHRSAALLQRGADPDARCERHASAPIHAAVGRGHRQIVELLLRYGADPNGYGDDSGFDAIGWAVCVEPQSVEVAELLLEHGARHNIFSAVAIGDVSVIEEITSRSRVELEKTTSAGFESQRPLHMAVTHRRPEALDKLIALGADLESKDEYTCTPLDRAALRSAEECVRPLLESGAVVGLPAAFFLQRQDRIEALMSADADCLRPGGKWDGLIGIAAQIAGGAVIESLLDWGASTDYIINSMVFGTQGYTPLHEAAYFGNMAAIEAFVRRGASLEKLDATFNCTPLQRAEHAQQDEAADYLREQSGLQP